MLFGMTALHWKLKTKVWPGQQESQWQVKLAVTKKNIGVSRTMRKTTTATERVAESLPDQWTASQYTKNKNKFHAKYIYIREEVNDIYM